MLEAFKFYLDSEHTLSPTSNSLGHLLIFSQWSVLPLQEPLGQGGDIEVRLTVQVIHRSQHAKIVSTLRTACRIVFYGNLKFCKKQVCVQNFSFSTPVMKGGVGRALTKFIHFWHFFRRYTSAIMQYKFFVLPQKFILKFW